METEQSPWEYTPARIEPYWQQYWENQKLFQAVDFSPQPKYYILDMFPYPSGAGLHVGHPLGYIATDILARYRKMQGYNVLHPMGFDAFGLPAEQYALQTGKHPRETTYANIARYRQQMKRIGLVYDWSREVITCAPEYYRWTQWIFLQMFHHWYDMKQQRARPIAELIHHLEKYGTENLHAWTSFKPVPSLSPEDWKQMDEEDRSWFLMNFRLAYLDTALVNWCPQLGTVLANEEVVWDEEKGLVSERGGYPVERKPMEQWFLRITAYAERLLQGLETIDWPPSIKELQRNWIGRSTGALIHFSLADDPSRILPVFTTRPDTIFGVTFMAVSPEYPELDGLIAEDRRKEVEDFLRKVQAQPERVRATRTEPSGVFTGKYAIHPFTGEKLPIWIADYILAHYGTGAIMGVPAHDERDWKFARKYHLPIRQVIEHPRAQVNVSAYTEKEGVLVHSQFLNGLSVPEAIERVIQEIERRKLGRREVRYRLRDFLFSRQRYWGEPIPIVYRPSRKGGKPIPEPVPEEELPVLLPELEDFQPSGDMKPPLARAHSWVHLPDGRFRETSTMPGWAGSNWYFLRYMDPHNDRLPVDPEKEAYWGPVDLYVGGAEHATAHLLYARFVHKFLKDIGIVSREEPFQKLFNQGMIQGTSTLIFVHWKEKKAYSRKIASTLPESVQKELMQIRIPVQFVSPEGELDLSRVTRLKEQFATFRDLEFIPDPDGKFRIATTRVEKMSKSYLNVVNPDEVIDQYGADTFRIYEMFLGPLEEHKPWDPRAIAGAHRFIRNVWEWLIDPKEGPRPLSGDPPPEELVRVLHRTIRKVSEDLENLRFNTAISQLMVALQHFRKHSVRYREIVDPFLRLLAPFAPHIAEELWRIVLKQKTSIFTASWPRWDERYLREAEMVYPITINGKKRLTLRIPAHWTPSQVEKFVREHPAVQKWIQGRKIRRVIVVPGKIVNLVVEKQRN